VSKRTRTDDVRLVFRSAGNVAAELLAERDTLNARCEKLEDRCDMRAELESLRIEVQSLRAEMLAKLH